MRFWFFDDDPERRRAPRAHGDRARCSSSRRSPRSPVAVAAAPSATRCSARTHADEIRAAVLGLWAFTNLEIAYALLRVEERRRAYVTASLPTSC